MTPGAAEQYQERKPAPEPLQLVQSFVNTLDVTEGTDVLADAHAGTSWLHESGLLGPTAKLTPRDLGNVRGVREAIRTMLLSNGRGPAPDVKQLRPLDAVARAVRPRLAVDPAGRVELAAGPPGRISDGLLRLLLVIRDAQQDGTWPRLKVCCNDECQWAFYDRSNSRRGAWCDMAVCGNVIKNRNLRARRTQL
jgi:predicted RNA-binding Zn ribbon-like protein